jgi:Secretion system C-terminal sorting domain/Copper type II ascorbate-dependent monooxygenase, C-terminal domain
MKKIVTLMTLITGLFFNALSAQVPTWAEKVSPILFKSCTGCHHAGGAAPFSLTTYADAKKYSASIHHAVSMGHMPPWPPDTKYSQFSYQRALADADKKAILDWVDGGALQGDATKAPASPLYSADGLVPNPDFKVQLPTFSLATDVDIYRCFPIKSGLAVDKFITQLECLPGNGSIVHHILIYQDQSNACFDLDARDPGPGYTSFGGIGSGSAQLIGAWVPGGQPLLLPKGFGVKLKANANIIVQIHYGPGSLNKKDSTTLKMRLSEANLRELNITPILNHGLTLANGPLVIPANSTKTFTAKFTVPVDITLISIAPHMHLIGKNVKVFGVPTTGDTLKLIKIDNWDFHWQGSYLFKKAMKIPRGTLLQSDAFYDNTMNNLNQPNNPPKEVTLGESTTDEMMLIYLTYAIYKAGDENLDLEKETALTGLNDTPLSKTDLTCFPNPASDALTLRFDLKESDNLGIQIFDYQGVMLKNFNNQLFQKGQNEKVLSVSDLPQGAYIVKLTSEKLYGVQYFVKM